jgi:DNA sulfur modification protein DndD
MKLIYIKLCNFRQFYGKTPEIILSSGERNTTIIHGNNGAGKTGILNAFTWGLYEKFTSAFAEENQLVNKKALAEAKLNDTVECWVEILWEHDSKKYRLKRECRAYNTNNNPTIGKTELRLQVAGDDGIWFIPHEHPEDIIAEILPNNLHQYFFFDGERIDKIVRSDKRAEISEATKKLIGVEILDKAIRHLGEAKKSLDSELKSIGDSQTKQLVKDLEKVQKELEKLQQRQEEIEQELNHQQILKKETNHRLTELSAAKQLQERRLQLEQQKSLSHEKLKKSWHDLKLTISSKGYMLFLAKILDEFQELMDNLRAQGELKSGISKEFLQELLREKRCLCGAELHPETVPHNQVISWLEKAGIAVVEENAIRLHTQGEEIEQKIPEIWQLIDKEQRNIGQLRTEVSQTENELEKIEEKLRKDSSEEIRNLQKRLDQIEAKIRDLIGEEAVNKQKILESNKQLEVYNKQITKQKANEEKQALCQRRMAATQEAIARLNEVKTRQEKRFKYELEKRIQEIFTEISFTGYMPQITDKYELALMDNSGLISTPVAASTGENQILSLSFIGAITDQVRKWSKKKIFIAPESGTFPIVMDSPFGSLDEISRRQVAKIIPKLANQLIVLVTKTQWRGEVQSEMADFIGKQYILTYYSTKSDCELDTIEIQGVSYPLVLQSHDGFDYTKIIEIDY